MEDDASSLAERARQPDFRLTTAERSHLLPWYDADALERLLGMLPPEERAGILEDFLVPAPGRQRSLRVSLGDPALDRLLAEVWAPFWDGCSDQELDEQPEYLPGRELARLRRRTTSERGCPADPGG